jgi:Txe/YoeB family toxin of Txe-Axe toxin-antitoxin module
MNLIFNELSIYPIFNNGYIAEESFKKLLRTFKKSREVYGFKHIHFPKNYALLQITTTETFYEWVSNLTNSTIKNLIIDLCKTPFTDELEDVELDAFFESDYILIGNNIPTQIAPVGLPVSHIKTIPAISLDSHLFWLNKKITIRKSNINSSENIDLTAFNICLDTDIETLEIKEWADMSMPKLIDNTEILTKYLGFTKYQSVFTDNFMNQFLNWKTDDFDSFKYILLLMKDVQIHPFSGGMGQTENLKNRGKEASKRINNNYPNGDRLSYTVENNIVTFIACKGHYEFH